MRSALACATVLIFGLFAIPARADELSEFHDAVEGVAVHYRAALIHIHAGHRDLATLEVDRTREAWGAVAARFGKPPRALSADRQLYTTVFVDNSTRLVTASMMVDIGRPQVAFDALIAFRDNLHRLRTANGIAVLSDCVIDAGIIMERLAVDGERIADIASDYIETLRRCDALAGGNTSDADFRRLVDTTIATLEKLRDADRIHDTESARKLIKDLRELDEQLELSFS